MDNHLYLPAQQGRTLRKESFTYFAIIAILYLGIVFIERAFPVGYVYLISEDMIGEYSTSVAFAAASGLFFASGMRSNRTDQRFLLLMSFASFVVAGEEISWGQRIFGVDTPEVLERVNWQGEITLHNIGPLQRASFHEVSGILLQILMLVSALSVRVSRMLPWIGKLSLPPMSLWPATVIVSYLLIEMPLVKGDEISEAFLAFVILIWSLLTALDLKVINDGAAKRERAVAVVLAATLASGLLLSTTFGMHMGWRYNMTASRDYPNAGMMEQSRVLFEHIMNNPDLIQSDTMENYRRLHD